MEFPEFFKSQIQNNIHNSIVHWDTDMFLPTFQNVTFWRATRCGFPKIAQKIQEKAKNHQYLTKNVHVW